MKSLLSDLATKSKLIRANPSNDDDSETSIHIGEGVHGTTSYMPPETVAIPSTNGGPRGYSDPYEDAKAQGYEEGYAQGMAEAAANAAALEDQYTMRANSAIQALLRAKDGVDDYQSRQLDEIAAQVCEAAYQIAEAIVVDTIGHDREPVIAAVRRAFQVAPKSRHADIYLNPLDAEALGVGEAPNSEIVVAASGRAITIIADPTVEVGGAVVTIGATTIDAQISKAMDRVRRVLRADDDQST